MTLKKPLDILRPFFKRKNVPWYVKIIRPVVVATAILFGANHLLIPNLPGRNLTPGERTMLSETFRESVNYDKVRVHHSTFGNAVRLIARAQMVTYGSLIITDSDTPDYSAQNVPFMPRYSFTHEMAHVWQNQNGVSEKFTDLVARQKIKLPGADQIATYQYSLSRGRDLTDFNIEKQASILTDYNFLVRPPEIAAKNINSPLNTDTFTAPGERKAAYESTLKKFLADPSYPRRK
jgi:hypothetical protein